MKKVILAGAISLVATTSAMAQTVQATITNIEPRYIKSYQNVPSTQCQDVQVPIYGTVQGNGASGGDVLAGMILGGILGKGVTGKDNGAAAGAVLGGVIAADNKKTKRDTRSKLVTTKEYFQERVIKHKDSATKLWLDKKLTS